VFDALAASRNPLRIIVLCGGESAEREISLQSGEAVCSALRSRGHVIHGVDPAETKLESVDWPRFDAAFIALHGRFGEDGGVQSLLDAWGVPYTGSPAASSRLAFSKSAAKERFAVCKVPTPPYRLIHVSDSIRQLQEVAGKLAYPLVMKPDASGSSLGVTIVQGPEELPSAAEECFRHGPFGLLEKAIPGTEWTLGMFDKEPLPLIRIESQQSFYNFTAKYEDAGTRYCLDPDVPPAVYQAIEDAGSAACRAIATRGIARVDLRVDSTLRPWVLEVNTIPGFTEHSLVPKAAERCGWTLGALCERAVRSCLMDRRHGLHNAQDESDRRNVSPMREAG
jgi:D-alanine-D-alanine ligase